MDKVGSRMKCFFHRADNDGRCSGALVKLHRPDCELIGINHGNPFPWDQLTWNEEVWMVDFTMQPFQLMERLAREANLIWIDHHRTALEEAQEKGFDPAGVREIGRGACELTQEWISGTVSRPVQLLGMYDVWCHEDPEVLPFQYRVRVEETLPTVREGLEFWRRLISGEIPLGPLVKEGRLLLRYQEQQDRGFCRAYSFETQLEGTDPDTGKPKRWTAVCANRGFTNSKVFDAVFDPGKHDLMITFCRLPLPEGQWKVSLYSPTVNCGAIARGFGGGGHGGAAGFKCETLPFEH